MFEILVLINFPSRNMPNVEVSQEIRYNSRKAVFLTTVHHTGNPTLGD